MLLLIIKQIRIDLSIPFFGQLVNEKKTWDIRDLYKSMRPRLKLYESRYSEDGLTKITMYEFNSYESYEEWNTNKEVVKRLKAREKFNKKNKIIEESELLEVTDDQLAEYKSQLLTEYWPRSAFMLHAISEFGPDKKIVKEKEQEDRLKYEPWFLKL